MSGAFDTLAAAQKLKESGLESKPAEAIAETIRDSQDNLATKADLDALERSLTARMDAQGQSLTARMDALEQSLNARMDAQGQSLNAKLDAHAQSTKADLNALEQSTKADFRELKTELLWIKRIGGAIVAVGMALLALAVRVAFFGLP